MNLGSIGNKILNPIDKNASLIGAGLRILEKIEPLRGSIGQLLQGHVHAPEFDNIIKGLGNDPSYTSAVVAIIAGMLAKESGVKMLTKVGSIVERGATAYLIAGVAENVLYYSTHSPAYPGTGGGNSGGYGY